MMESSLDYPITLVFDRDDPCYTTIEEHGRIKYTIETDRRLKQGSARGEEIIVTRVYDENQELIAERDWKEISSDVIRLRSRGMEKKMSMSDWIKKSFMPVNRSATFKDLMGRKYKWDKHGYRFQYRLLAKDVSSKDPIAWFERAQPYVTKDNPVPTLSRLHLSTRADEIRDEVVVSFLFLEKDRRAGTSQTQRAATAMMTGDAYTAGFSV